MVEWLWRRVAWLVTRRPVRDWILRRASRRRYDEIGSYMWRGWVFNPYPAVWWCPISIRVNHIKRADQERHEHDHPWNCRSIILIGGYSEVRGNGAEFHRRRVGDTVRLRFGEYHRIVSVAPEYGAVTLFITGRKRGTWGFSVNGRKVPHRDYAVQQ